MLYSHYQVGGSLQANHPTYVIRQADTDLLAALQQGEFCYTFNARQMGKSSLMVRIKHQLEQVDYRCVVIDMTCIGSDSVSMEQWYKSLAYELWLGLDLTEQIPLGQWWQANQDMSPVYRLTRFIHEILQYFPTDRLVILIDEIDSVLSLPFSAADFFGLIRYCYHQRSLNPDFNRLTFALFGVTTPSVLVQDKSKTPFNIGRAIDLCGFQLNEVQPLLKLFEGKIDRAEVLMQEILKWTNGQPFLTQKLCQIVLQIIESSQPESLVIPIGAEAFWIENLVQSHILQAWESQDEPEHLRTIRDRLLQSSQRGGRVLSLYQQIWQLEPQWQNGDVEESFMRQETRQETHQEQSLVKQQLETSLSIAADGSAEQQELLLSGLAICEQGELRVKNRIYQKIFDERWIQQQLSLLRPYAQAIESWESSAQVDSSRLLRGQALRDAQQWAQDKKLSDRDYQFLAASQQLDQQEMQQALEAARLREVETRLEVEQRSVRRQRLWLALVGGNLGVALLLGCVIFQQYRQAAIREVKALATTSETFYLTHQNLDALVMALKATSKLRSIGSADTSATEQVARTLRQAIYNTSEINRFEEPHSAVQAVAMSANGRLVASGTQDRIVRLWQPDGTLLRTLYGHSESINSIAFTHNNRLLASAGDDRTTILWQVDGRKLIRLIGHTGPVTSVAFSADDQTIASASQDKTVRLWAIDGTLLTTLVGHQDIVRDVAFSPDGAWVVTASDDQTVKLWTRQGQLLRTLQDHQGSVRTVAFSPNNRTIVSGGKDGTLKLWTVEGRLIRTLKGHRAAIQDVVFSPLGQWIASASSDRTIKLWNRDGILLATLQGHQKSVQSLVFSPEGRMLISGSADETIRLWRVKNVFLTPLVGHDAAVTAVAFNPIDQTLVTGSEDRTVRLWNRRGSMLRVLQGHQDGISAVAINPNGRLIASASRDQTIRLWDRDGSRIATLKGHRAAVRSVTFSPSGRQMISGGEDSMIWLWDRWGHPLHSWVAHVGAATDVAFSPISPLLASVSADGAVKFWQSSRLSQLNLDPNKVERREWDLLTSFGAYDAEMAAIAFAPNSSIVRKKQPEQLATAWNKTVNIWNIDGTIAVTLRGHHGKVRDVAFSPDGQLIASASEDNTVKLWSRSGQEITTLDSHGAAVRAVAFSPDGRMLASVSDDRTGLLWDLQLVLDTSALQTYGCAWIQDYLHTSPTLEMTDRQMCDRVSSFQAH